jgi:hypothetical protein
MHVTVISEPSFLQGPTTSPQAPLDTETQRPIPFLRMKNRIARTEEPSHKQALSYDENGVEPNESTKGRTKWQRWWSQKVANTIQVANAMLSQANRQPTTVIPRRTRDSRSKLRFEPGESDFGRTISRT